MTTLRTQITSLLAAHGGLTVAEISREISHPDPKSFDPVETFVLREVERMCREGIAHLPSDGCLYVLTDAATNADPTITTLLAVRAGTFHPDEHTDAAVQRAIKQQWLTYDCGRLVTTEAGDEVVEAVERGEW